MEDNRQEEDRSMHEEIAGFSDLELNMQALSIAVPGISSVQADQLQQEEELDFSFCLLMKLACTGGVPRSVSKQAVQQSMAKAWRENYYAISQVSDSVFLAHFRSHDAMMSVYTRQPWIMGSDNWLFEWFDLGDEVSSSGDYKFDYIFVTVRAYGIPRIARSLSLLGDILNQVGAVSEYHMLQQNMLFAKQDYIWGIAKLKVSEPVKDKIQIKYPNNSFGLAYLHYEKIKRICLFCGIMFHNVQHCPLRTNILRERSKKGLPVHDFPSQRYGQWIIDEDLVPLEAIRSSGITNVGHQQQPNPVLTKLQRLFAEDPRGKGKQFQQVQSRQHSVHQDLHCLLAKSIAQGQVERSTTFIQPNIISGSLRTEEATVTDQLLPTLQPGTVPISPQTYPALKRPPPNEIPAAPPLAKRFSHLPQHLEHGEEKGIAKVSMQLPPGEQVIATTAGQLAVTAPNITRAGNIGAVRAGETESEAVEAGATTPAETTIMADFPRCNADGRPRRRPTGWDVPPPAQDRNIKQVAIGYTHSHHGAEVWVRNGNSGSVGLTRKPLRQSGGCMAHPYTRSSYRQSPRSNPTSPADHDAWPIHSPLLSYLPGTLDSRIGGFPPPHVSERYHLGTNDASGANDRGSQEYDGDAAESVATSTREGGDVQEDLKRSSGSMDLDQRALAPAHEAPRAP